MFFLLHYFHIDVIRELKFSTNILLGEKKKVFFVLNFKENAAYFNNNWALTLPTPERKCHYLIEKQLIQGNNDY